MRVRPGVQTAPRRRAHRIDDPTAGARASEFTPNPTSGCGGRSGWGHSCLATRGLGCRPGPRPNAPPPAPTFLPSSLAAETPGLGLLATEWAPGSGYPGPVRPPSLPTARCREPFLAMRVPGPGPLWVTHLDRGPSGGHLASLPAPPRRPSRPTDTEAEVRPDAPPTDSPRQPLEAPCAIA